MNLPGGQNINRVFLKCLPCLPCSWELDCSVGSCTHTGWGLPCLKPQSPAPVAGSSPGQEHRSRRVTANRAAPVLPCPPSEKPSLSQPLNCSSSSLGCPAWSVLPGPAAHCPIVPLSHCPIVPLSHCPRVRELGLPTAGLTKCPGKGDPTMNILQSSSQGHPTERKMAETPWNPWIQSGRAIQARLGVQNPSVF